MFGGRYGIPVGGPEDADYKCIEGFKFGGIRHVRRIRLHGWWFGYDYAIVGWDRG